jgi:hypothetical protein
VLGSVIGWVQFILDERVCTSTSVAIAFCWDTT